MRELWCELQCIRIEVCGSCGVWSLKCFKVVALDYYSWRSCGEGELRCEGIVVCVMVAVYRNYSLWWLRLMGIAVWGSCGV